MRVDRVLHDPLKEIADLKREVESLKSTALARIGNVGADLQTYTPTLTASPTSPTLGTGSLQQGHYVRIGRVCHAFFKIKFGTSGAAAGSGGYRVSVPFDRVSGHDDIGVGQAIIIDNSPSTVDLGICFITASEPAKLAIRGQAGTLSNSYPWTWSNEDIIEGSVTYIVA